MRWTIARKVGLLVVIISVGLLASQVVALALSRRMVWTAAETVSSVEQVRAATAKATGVAAARISILEVNQWLTDVSATKDESGYEKAEHHARQFGQDLAALREAAAQSGSTGEIQELDRLRAAFDNFYAEGKRMAKAYVVEGTKAGNVFMPSFDSATDRMAKALDPVLARSEKERLNSIENISAMSAAGRRQAEGAQSMLLVVGIVLFVGLLSASIIGARAITRPLVAAARTATALAQGDINQVIEHKSNDEFGQMADAFRQLIEYVRGIAQAAEALGRGDLSVAVTPRSAADVLSRSMASTADSLRSVVAETRRLTAEAEHGHLSERGNAAGFPGAYGELVGGLNSLVEAVARPLGELKAVLGEVASHNLTARMTGDYVGDFATVKSSLNTALGSLHDGLVSVAVAVEQVSSAADQIASSSQAVAQGASEQARSIEEASTNLKSMAAMTSANAASTKEASALASNANASSEQGSQSMGRMTEAMGKIRNSAEGTAAIIRDINEIAFQTNPLALNAAVEAARAGAAGRGFAVVAEEVRNLALRSKEAAKKTESLINDSVALAKHGESVSTQVSQNLSEVTHAVSQVTGIIQDIAKASAEQSAGFDQLKHAVGEMDSVTQQNAASSEESSSAAQELAGQAQEMSVLVNRFKLERAGSPVSPSRLRSRVAGPSGRRPEKGNGVGKPNGNGARVVPFDDDPVFKDF